MAIVFEPLKSKMKQEGISTYWLINQGVSPGTIQKIRKNGNINTKTLDQLCQILHCSVSDIIKYVET